MLGLLAHRDAGIAGPAAQLPVTVERQLQAALLMRVDRLDAVFAVQGGDHIGGGAGAHDEAAAPSLEGGGELAQRAEDKVELPARMFRQGPISRLENVNGQNRRAARHRRKERGVVMNPEVPFEPDKVNARHGTNIEHPGTSDKSLLKTGRIRAPP